MNDPGRAARVPHPADRWLRRRNEPPLDELLDDETLRKLMASDSVARDQLMNLIWALRYAARVRGSKRGE